MLYAETRGQGGKPVVLLHGFTQSGRSWAPIEGGLADSRAVTTIDAPGHGRSADVEADLETGADLMYEVVPGPAAWVGYSMGGRYALHVALRHPDVVTKMVLVSTTAGIDDARQRADRRQSDSALADRAEREGLEPFVRWWLEQPLFASLPSSSADVESRLGGTASGLASSLRLAGAGSQAPLWNRLGALSRVPVLVVAGERDQKYVDLGRRLVESIGDGASLHVVEGAGHACHLEAPDRFLDAVVPFLDGAG